jgi:hypothetical protein
LHLMHTKLAPQVSFMTSRQLHSSASASRTAGLKQPGESGDPDDEGLVAVGLDAEEGDDGDATALLGATVAGAAVVGKSVVVAAVVGAAVVGAAVVGAAVVGAAVVGAAVVGAAVHQPHVFSQLFCCQ